MIINEENSNSPKAEENKEEKWTKMMKTLKFLVLIMPDSVSYYPFTNQILNF